MRQLKQVIDWVVKYSHTENELNETECKYISENIGTDHVNINNDTDMGLLMTQGLAGWYKSFLFYKLYYLHPLIKMKKDFRDLPIC